MSNTVTPTLKLTEHGVNGLPDPTAVVDLPTLQLFPGIVGALIVDCLKGISLSGEFTTDVVADTADSAYTMTETFTATDNIPLVPVDLLHWSRQTTLTDAEGLAFLAEAPSGITAQAVLSFV